MTSWTDYQDDISDAISESMDVDWSANVGAQAVVAWLNEHRPISAAPAPEGGADREQIARCIIGPRLPVPATSRFSLSDLRDVRWEAASPEDRADALSAADAIIALATREEGPAEAGSMIVKTPCQHCLRMTTVTPESLALYRDHLRAQPQAREVARPIISAGRVLADALRQYGFPVSGGAKAALSDHGSAEALALNEACVAFLAALQAEQKGGA